MKPLLLTLLRAYQLGIRPLLGQNCRFFPSCSDYAQQAITAHGALRGSLMAGRRLCKCHPWHPGGFDPVPKLHPQSATATPSDQTAQPHS